MKLFFLVIQALFLLSTATSAQEVIRPDSPSSTTPEKNTEELEIKLEVMPSSRVFVLREIAGIYPVLVVDSTGQKVCAWIDEIKTKKLKLMKGDDTLLCKCEIYQIQNRIGLNLVDENNKVVQNAKITSWRKLPYLND